MARWRQIIGTIAHNADEYFDELRHRLSQRFGGDDPITIVPYYGHGTADQFFLGGRVLEQPGVSAATDNDSLWDNLVNTYRRFESDEIPGARIMARFQGVEQEVVADSEGFFQVQLRPAQPLPADRLRHEVALEVREPQWAAHGPAKATGCVFVPPPHAQFGVISDIDDTVVRTDAANLLRMARSVFLGNARTRLPFKGVAALYRALQQGTASSEAAPDVNPLFYVSSSPWNLYDLLLEFFTLHNIPHGPIFLRDWGISEQEILPTQHRGHKLAAIRQVLDRYPHLPFILIGDSGQEDPEIYHEVVRLYPGRIPAVYIRNVSHTPERPAAIRKLAEEIIAVGSTLILADDTLAVARHAAEQGWIAPETVWMIEMERELDAAPAGPAERLLGETQAAAAPTVVIDEESADQTQAAVEGGAIEQALQSGDRDEPPPTVIVEGEKE
ncbi:MAG TPA: phosphatase domain-containing protein [Herpetosiphonaceae bacterium]